MPVDQTLGINGIGSQPRGIGSQPRLPTEGGFGAYQRAYESAHERAYQVLGAYARAQQVRKPDYSRIPLDEIGFLPDDADELRVDPSHVHRVAQHCVAAGTKLDIYQHVCLVEIPSDELQDLLDANREAIENDPLMPRFSPNIKYVCIGQQDFVYAHKLAKDGSRTLYNAGTVPIAWKETDWEGWNILKRGPLCAIYASSLLLDYDALYAVAMVPIPIPIPMVHCGGKKNSWSPWRPVLEQQEPLKSRLRLVEIAMAGEHEEDTRATLHFVKSVLATRHRLSAAASENRQTLSANVPDSTLPHRPNASSKRTCKWPCCDSNADLAAQCKVKAACSPTSSPCNRHQIPIARHAAVKCLAQTCKVKPTCAPEWMQEDMARASEPAIAPTRVNLRSASALEKEHWPAGGCQPHDVEMMTTTKRVLEEAKHGMAPADHEMAPAGHETTTSEHLRILAEQFQGMTIATPTNMPAEMLEQHVTLSDPVADHDAHVVMRQTRPRKPKNHTPTGKEWRKALRAHSCANVHTPEDIPLQRSLGEHSERMEKCDTNERRRYTIMTAVSSGGHGDPDMLPNAALMFKGPETCSQYETTSASMSNAAGVGEPIQAQSSSSASGW